MSLEELWYLFPVYLTKPQMCWKKWYLEEESLLKKSISKVDRISHIGSTSIGSIYDKPIIDIGYICMSECAEKISFNKGYTENGFVEKVFHFHLKYSGNNDEFYFRDYLIEYTNVAREYEKLKLKLCKKYKYNRDAYTSAKTEFVENIHLLQKINIMIYISKLQFMGLIV